MTFSLQAYPRGYRARYAEPMEQLFRDRLREVHTFAELAVLWARTLTDWAASVPARHWERTPPHAYFNWPEGLDPYRRCLFFARREASSFSCSEITLEHLVLGILQQEPSLVSEQARESMVRTIEANEPASRRIPLTEDLRLSRATVRAAIAANVFARTAGRDEVAPQDLVAGILRETDTLAARLLRKYGGDQS
jgi:hypothetical protein